jgi:hypothetical protein
MGYIGCPIFQVAQKAMFLQTPHEVDVKNIVKKLELFFGNIEIYCGDQTFYHILCTQTIFTSGLF